MNQHRSLYVDFLEVDMIGGYWQRAFFSAWGGHDRSEYIVQPHLGTWARFFAWPNVRDRAGEFEFARDVEQIVKAEWCERVVVRLGVKGYITGKGIAAEVRKHVDSEWKVVSGEDRPYALWSATGFRIKVEKYLHLLNGLMVQRYDTCFGCLQVQVTWVRFPVRPCFFGSIPPQVRSNPRYVFFLSFFPSLCFI